MVEGIGSRDSQVSVRTQMTSANAIVGTTWALVTR
jgi:hypothetical protein